MGEWLTAILISAAILLVPAMFNRFPLIFPDTAAYLGVAYEANWTLDRAAFYGLLFKPLLLATPPLAGLWTAIVLQAVAIAAVLVLAVRQLAPSYGPAFASAVVAVTAVFSSLPWHAAQLMPDAMTGPLVLLAWLAASRDVKANGTASLWAATALFALLHYTHLGLVAAVVGASLLVWSLAGTPLREIARRAFAAALVIAAVAAAHVSVHGLYFNRWSVSPMGSWFLFARLYEDGPAQRWLDRHCGRDAPAPLCEIHESMPKDSQKILWGDFDSPLFTRVNQNVGTAESWRWMDMLHQVATESIKEEPLAFAAGAASGATSQFISFQAVDDECPRECGMQQLMQMRPALTAPLRQSRQLQGQIPKTMIRSVTTPVAIFCLLLLLPSMLVAFRRKDYAAISLLMAVSACLVVNAAMAGALSDVHDRYQSRVVWLAVFAAIVVGARWQRTAGRHRPPLRPSGT